VEAEALRSQLAAARAQMGASEASTAPAPAELVTRLRLQTQLADEAVAETATAKREAEKLQQACLQAPCRM
jgi:hypothetical protein